MSAKLIFSDIDGTLINNELKVTPKTRDASDIKLSMVIFLYQLQLVFLKAL